MQLSAWSTPSMRSCAIVMFQPCEEVSHFTFDSAYRQMTCELATLDLTPYFPPPLNLMCNGLSSRRWHHLPPLCVKHANGPGSLLGLLAHTDIFCSFHSTASMSRYSHSLHNDPVSLLLLLKCPTAAFRMFVQVSHIHVVFNRMHHCSSMVWIASHPSVLKDHE